MNEPTENIILIALGLIAGSSLVTMVVVIAILGVLREGI